MKIYGPCLCLAGPGSGKTHTIVERIKYMIENEGISPSEILVITFSNKAAKEMKQRFYRVSGNKNYPVYFGTFHSIYYSIVKRYYKLANDSVLLEKDKWNILNFILRNKNIEEDNIYKKDILQNISTYKILLKSNQDKDKFLASIENKDDFLEIYNEFTMFCRKTRKIDFDDMLYLCSDLLHKNKDLLELYRGIYKYILVDEFQDINDIQYDVLMMLAGDTNNVFVVGDDDQAIYGFRGSKPEYMQKFIQNNDNCEVINLSKNYRCAECVIDSAISLIKKNVRRIDKLQIAGKKDKHEGTVIVENFVNEIKEAGYVLDRIREHQGESIAIIYRTTRCVSALRERLVVSGFKLNGNLSDEYYMADWIKDVITYIRLAEQLSRIPQEIYEDGKKLLDQLPDNNKEQLFSILNKPDRGLTRDFLYGGVYKNELNRLVKDLLFIHSLNPYGAVNYIFKAIGYEKYYLSMGIKKSIELDVLKEQVEELIERTRAYRTNREWIYAIDCMLSGSKIVEDEIHNGDKCENDFYINMLTAHASKGLEFDTVFVVGLQEGIFPHRKAITNELIEEERRLLYVAMTRAKKNLYVLGRGEEKNGKRVSRFVSEIEVK